MNPISQEETVRLRKAMSDFIAMVEIAPGQYAQPPPEYVRFRRLGDMDFNPNDNNEFQQLSEVFNVIY